MSLESEQGCLPNGWIVKTSLKYPDRVYYFNTMTGCSTWECPELVPNRFIECFKGPASKRNLSRCSDSEHEGAGRFSTSIHTPDESPSYSKTSNTYNNNSKSQKRKFEGDNNNSKSQKRKFEGVLIPPIDAIFKPPAAIVNPVTLDQEQKSSTTLCISSQGSKRKKKKSKSKAKNKIIPQIVAKNLIVNKNKQISLIEPQHKKIQKKEKSPKATLSTRQYKSSTSSFVSNESYETGSIDSDTALEFGPSGWNPIVPSRNITSYDFNEDNSFEDVEMIDVSANLTSVEEIFATAKKSNEPHSHYIVVDTNIFVHELNHIDELKDTALEGCGPPHIFIPWVVVKELDGLKTSNKGIGKSACKAVRYLHKILKLKHPRFHGQSAKEAEECKQSYHDNNDDRIIDCCHSLRAKMPAEKVILMTNDKNLANKAMIYGIIVHDWTSLLKDLKPDISIKASSKQLRKTQTEQSDSANTNYKAQKHLEVKLLKERKGFEIEIDNVMDKARLLLKDFLDPILELEMKRAYGDKWWDFNIDRRLLREIIAAFIKFWPNIFSFVFKNEAKNNFDLLHEKLISPAGFYNSLEECLEILHAIKDIFHSIRGAQPNMPSLIVNVQVLADACSHLFRKRQEMDSTLCIVQSSIQEAEEKSALDVLNHNWTVVNDLCGAVMDFFGMQHTYVYNKQDEALPESEYRRIVAELFPRLLQLKQLMKKMLFHVQNSTENKALFKKLFVALKELVPSLNIKTSKKPDMTDFSPVSLERFCRNPQNRQKVQLGCEQLDNFCDKLKEAVQGMSNMINLKL